MTRAPTLQKICDKIISESHQNPEPMLTLDQLDNKIKASIYPELFRDAIIRLWPKEGVNGPNTSFVEATMAYANDEDNGHPYILTKKLARLAYLSDREEVPAGIFVEEVYNLMQR